MTMSCDDAGTRVVQRFEVFSGAGTRREWPSEVKAAIVAESYSGQETVCAVARRHGLSHGQLFTWRRELRKKLEAQGLSLPAKPAPMGRVSVGDRISIAAPSSFVPAVVDPLPAGDPTPASRRRRKRRRLNAGAVELEIDGVSVTVGRGADAEVIGAVIAALRATR
jgi:transposase